MIGDHQALDVSTLNSKSLDRERILETGVAVKLSGYHL
jgi:hypothetical protein